ncbi:hypothetical protein SAMN05660649_03883 [Desulfotomaculum arcticum]|uniref:Uncharacterized protein n=1 Tax=Desulfotruncus arcticus DSM 17038 TaxID=1121424 RepID=A0A1I2XCP3_9FIRM|nr:hypothetical protein [Desulfotruncus arcticus]SFH10466.1 hypothetical protein SAMN05660649_03883 [Desulfotomaculum arcticum] [Desulfotruncus arcticus DSM 17038]
MKLKKETKKYKVYEVDLGLLGQVILKDPLYGEGKIKMKTGDYYFLVKFEHPQNGTKSQCECDQDEPYLDLKSDVERIRNSKIKGSRFYSNWMKLFFKKDEKYTIKRNGIEATATYYGQDTFKRNTHYFLINGEKVKADNLVYKGYTL